MTQHAFRPIAALLRTVVATLALLAPLALAGLPAAGATDTVTIPLDPVYVELSFAPQQNVGTMPVALPLAEGSFHALPARWGGSVTVTVPPQKVDTGQVGASLTLETDDGTHTGSYSTDPNAPLGSRLSMTAVGANRYRIGLPADDGRNGPVARLRLYGLELRPGLDVLPLDPPSFVLRMSAEAPASVELSQQPVAVSCPPGREETAGCGPTPPPLPAGAELRITLPQGSKLRALGLTGLSNSAFALAPRDPDSWPSRIAGTALAATVSADRATATTRIPAAMAPGPYQFQAVVGEGAGQLVSMTALDVQVAAGTGSSPPSSGSSSSSPGGATSSRSGGAGQDGTPGGTGGGMSRGQLGVLVSLGAIAVLAAGSTVAFVAHRRRHPHQHA